LSERDRSTTEILRQRVSLTHPRNPLVGAVQAAFRGMELRAPAVDAVDETLLPPQTTLEQVRSANASRILAQAVEHAG
jgi:hypothetical protein